MSLSGPFPLHLLHYPSPAVPTVAVEVVVNSV